MVQYGVSISAPDHMMQFSSLTNLSWSQVGLHQMIHRVTDMHTGSNGAHQWDGQLGTNSSWASLDNLPGVKIGTSDHMVTTLSLGKNHFVHGILSVDHPPGSTLSSNVYFRHCFWSHFKPNLKQFNFVLDPWLKPLHGDTYTRILSKI
jgi:hypothetical protein